MTFEQYKKRDHRMLTNYRLPKQQQNLVRCRTAGCGFTDEFTMPQSLNWAQRAAIPTSLPSRKLEPVRELNSVVGATFFTLPSVAGPRAPPSTTGATVVSTDSTLLNRRRSDSATRASSEAPTAAMPAPVHMECPALNADSLRFIDALSSSIHETKKDRADTFEITRRGILNIRNNCFLSAILQALLSCRLFRSLIVALNQHGNGPVNALKASGHTVLAALWQFAVDMNAQPSPMLAFETKLLAPTASESAPQNESKAQRRRRRRKQNREELTIRITKPVTTHWQGTAHYSSAMEQLINQFSKHARGDQEDAQEFLHFMLEALHDELCRLDKRPRTRRSSHGIIDLNSLQLSDNHCDAGWQEVGKRNKKQQVTAELKFDESVVSQIFGGRLRIQLRKHGTLDSVSYEPFFTLSLSVENDVLSLEDALESFAAADSVRGLREGTREVTADWITRFDSLSPVLVFHLKRFSYGPRGAHKICRFISYPASLRFPRRMMTRRVYDSTNHVDCIFTLCAVIVHHGETSARGHYSAFGIVHQNGGLSLGHEWIHFDDHNLSRVTENEALEQQAYLLFYERQIDVIN